MMRCRVGARHDEEVGARDDETLNQVQGDEEGNLKQFLIFDHRNL